jgi:hypothetical protein
MSGPRRVVLALVSHTNVGKTTLARTLLRRDVGEVLDQAHVTDTTEPFALFENERGESVVLTDNPGFGDSVRLLGRLRGLPDPLAWLVGQVWDRFADRPLYCSQQAVRHVRDEADVVLYLVNASEDPEQAGYLDPELELLAWIGRPVVLLLNQTGAPADAAARERDVARWRALGAGSPVVRDVLPLDAFTRCWLQEGLLYGRLREVVPAERRDLLDGLLERWRAAETLAARLREAASEADERLIALHGLDGEAAKALRVEIGDVTAPELRTPTWQRSLWGGVLGGALGGLAADIATGGLSLGGGALVGALLGVAGGGGLAYGMELLRGEEEPRAAWSPAFLDRLAADALLRYLAVAHFGRGAGSFRARDHPALFQEVSERALQAERDALRQAFSRARAGPGDAREEIAAPLARGLRRALAELHPEAASLVP